MPLVILRGRVSAYGRAIGAGTAMAVPLFARKK